MSERRTGRPTLRRRDGLEASRGDRRSSRSAARRIGRPVDGRSPRSKSASSSDSGFGQCRWANADAVARSLREGPTRTSIVRPTRSMPSTSPQLRAVLQTSALPRREFPISCGGYRYRQSRCSASPLSDVARRTRGPLRPPARPSAPRPTARAAGSTPTTRPCPRGRASRAGRRADIAPAARSDRAAGSRRHAREQPRAQLVDARLPRSHVLRRLAGLERRPRESPCRSRSPRCAAARASRAARASTGSRRGCSPRPIARTSGVIADRSFVSRPISTIRRWLPARASGTDRRKP